MDTASNVQLRGRIDELEEQLATATRRYTANKQTEVRLRDTLAYAESIVDTVRGPLLVLDGKLRVKTASHAFYRTLGEGFTRDVSQVGHADTGDLEIRIQSAADLERAPLLLLRSYQGA